MEEVKQGTVPRIDTWQIANLTRLEYVATFSRGLCPLDWLLWSHLLVNAVWANVRVCA